MKGDKKDIPKSVSGNSKGTPTTDKNSPTLLQEVRTNLEQIIKGIESRSQGPILRVLRRTNKVRRHLGYDGWKRVVETYISDSNPCKKCLITGFEELDFNFGPQVDADAGTISEEEVESEKSVEPKKLEQLPALTTPSGGNVVYPAVEVYLSNIVIVILLKNHKNYVAADIAFKVLEYFTGLNKRNLDLFTAQTVGHLSLAHQHLGTLSSIRKFLLKAHRTACLNHNEFGQATIVNLLLRNYLHDNAYDQAARLVAKVRFPESASVNQYVRYLYYLGRIECVQLEYTASYQNLNQAYRKAPQNTGIGFRTAVTKLSIIVQLLMGDIPDRSLFSEPSTSQAVTPYLELTQAVRFGRLDVFKTVLEKFKDVFKRDANINLVQRLRQTVLKIGLRRINTSYSRISFGDIAAKLKLDSAIDAEYVCAKNIRDGVIKAQLDHDLGAMISEDRADLYSTPEPQQSFHDRISFCLEMHDSAVKAMRYPPNAFRTTTGEDAVVESVDIEVVEESDSDE
jgi:26S proteasome regulatory subunit N3